MRIIIQLSFLAGNNISIFISMKLKQYRLKAGLSLREMASKIGISYTMLHRYETGERRPSLSRLLLIKKYTGGKVALKDFE